MKAGAPAGGGMVTEPTGGGGDAAACPMDPISTSAAENPAPPLLLARAADPDCNKHPKQISTYQCELDQVLNSRSPSGWLRSKSNWLLDQM